MVDKITFENWPGKGIGTDKMERVRLDVMQGKPVDGSYSDGMKEYRAYFEKWKADLPEGAVVDFPTLL